MAKRRALSKKPGKSEGSRLPSPDPATNLVIADIVLRGASVIMRKRLEKGLLTRQLDPGKAKRLVENRGMVKTIALWGASRIAMRSPLGLVVVAGGLAAKVLYDRGKRNEAPRSERKRKRTDTES